MTTTDPSLIPLHRLRFEEPGPPRLGELPTGAPPGW